MKLLRFIGYLPPQILIVLFIAGSKDMLKGWNQTSEAFTTIVVLFVVSPVITGVIVILDLRETVVRRHDPNRPSRWVPLLSLLIFVESLGIDGYLLTQISM